VSQAMLPRFPLHQAMLLTLEEGLAREEYNPENLQCVSTRKIYRGRAEDVITFLKIQEKNPTIDFLGLVLPRLHYTILEAEPRDILYMLIHDIHYTRERMFRSEGNRMLAVPWLSAVASFKTGSTSSPRATLSPRLGCG
jgi:hypothetical protein